MSTIEPPALQKGIVPPSYIWTNNLSGRPWHANAALPFTDAVWHVTCEMDDCDCDADAEDIDE